MNVTELARILRISPQELKEKLPKLGFDIGQKAIKIDKRIAQRIIEEWPKLRRRLEQIESLERQDEENAALAAGREKTKIEIPRLITVRDFAAVLKLPVNRILAKLMESGIFISLNEKMDFDTAAIVGADLGFEIAAGEEKDVKEETGLKISEIVKREKTLEPRPPVIVVMGHVDHGKTSLLDAIRKTNVVSGEAGGITQHIGAYQVERKNQLITFIDTPGHEAFTAMRGRGAKVADIAILVVAADDGVKPQTIEACQIIRASGIPFVVAINKIDKPEADLNRVKQELSAQLNITPEDWGGKTVCVPVSAKQSTGIEELLDMVLLAAEMESDNIKANPEGQTAGTIIESKMDKGEGPIATILIQNGRLKTGDNLVLDGKIIGRVRALKNWKGEKISEVLPSAPAKIIGLKIAPEVGDIITTGEGEREKIKKTVGEKARAVQTKTDNEEEGVKKIYLLIKADVLGSAEAIEESLEKINTAEVKVKVVGRGLGNISEGDLKNAEASSARIIGFNVKIPPQIEEIAREKNIEIKFYRVIYHLLNDIKKEMEELIQPETERKDLGKLKVIAIFKKEKNAQIVGGKIIEGRAEADAKAEVLRGNKKISQGKITELQSGKTKVNSVEEGQECGIRFEGDPIITAGDIIAFYKSITKNKES